MKKKIGIITILPRNNNYGGILQGLALQNFLKSCGYDPFLIQRINNKPTFFATVKNLVKKILGKGASNSKDWFRISVHMNAFVEKYFTPVTDIIDSNYKVNSVVDRYGLDAVVVGSDQVWRELYNKDRKANFFLDFVPNSVVKLSYAASFGVDTWDYSVEETIKYSKLAKRFQAISVREDSAVALCNDYLGVNAEVVLDPTLLVGRSFYENIVMQENCKPGSGNLLVYMIGKTEVSRNIISKIEKDYSCKSFFVGRTENTQVFPPVPEWIRGFMDADFVFTDSYHGCIFSIIFNKPFLILGNKNTGVARYQSLLKLFSLSERLIFSEEDYRNGILGREIDWNYINATVSEKIERSKQFFKENIR